MKKIKSHEDQLIIADIIKERIYRKPEGATWKQIRIAVSKEYHVKNWLEVRYSLGLLLIKHEVERTMDIHEERYIPLQ